MKNWKIGLALVLFAVAAFGADKTVNNPSDYSVIEKYVDMGDGTFAKRIVVAPATGSVSERTGISAASCSGGVASASLIAAGVYSSSVTIINTHATQTLYVSFNTPATTSDFPIAPKAALTIPFGPSNTLYAIGSGAATTCAIIGA